MAYGLVYHYFESKEEILNTLFLERWQIMLDAIAEIDAARAPGAREALLGRRLHHRLLPPRPGPDEGDHRRGHARGELVRRASTWTRSARPTTGIAAIVETAREDGSFKSGIPAEFAAMCFYGAIEQLLTGWIFELLPQHRRGVRARQGAGRRGDLRRSRDRRRTAPPAFCLNRRAMEQRPDQAPHVERPARRSGRAHHDRRATASPTAIWMRVFNEDPPDRLMADDQSPIRARPGAPAQPPRLGVAAQRGDRGRRRSPSVPRCSSAPPSPAGSRSP